MMTVEEFLAEKGRRTDAALEAHLATWDGAPPRLLAAVRYCLFAGGKRFRPALALGAAEVVAGSDEAALPAACALEMIHTYSLVHDDLPAMDNDDLRRGRPTLHRQFDEATAILAGDALLTMAFDVAADCGSLAIVREVARAAGVLGMVGGQQWDMEGEGQGLDLAAMRRIHAMKTGAMIRASARTGAMAAGASEPQVEALTRYGEQLGLAFQIVDDILDVVGDEQALGKPIGSDVGNDKSTYPSLVGLEQARVLAREAMTAALEALSCFGPEADALRALARYTVERDR